MTTANPFRVTLPLTMEAASTFEKSADFYKTAWRIILENSHLHSRCCENPKFNLLFFNCEFVF
jgi:hypothetical protein